MLEIGGAYKAFLTPNGPPPGGFFFMPAGGASERYRNGYRRVTAQGKERREKAYGFPGQ